MIRVTFTFALLTGCLLGSAQAQGVHRVHQGYPTQAQPKGQHTPVIRIHSAPAPAPAPAPIPAPAPYMSSHPVPPPPPAETGCASCEEVPAECSSCECPKCEEEKKGWCNHGDPFDISTMILGEESQFDFGGWTTFGYHTANTGFPGGAPGVAGVMFNNQEDRVNLHQQWLYAERVADGSKGFDWGFRVDAIYGIDGTDTQAFGNRPGTWDFQNGWGNGDRETWAMPQLYAEVAMGDLSVKAGHFYTIIGYETVAAPTNFFYSHAFTFFFNEPFTHTGVLGSYQVNEKLSVTGGWVAGNDTGFVSVNNGSAFLGSISCEVIKGLTLSYALNIGDLGFTGTGIHYTALLDWNINDKWEYVLQHDGVKHDNTDNTTYHGVSIVNYLFYKINDCVRLGGRGEWTKVLGVDYYAGTAGLNFSPCAGLVLRPEYRYQWSPVGQGGNNPLGVPADQGIFGIDVVWTY